jgi:hypothetical protein
LALRGVLLVPYDDLPCRLALGGWIGLDIPGTARLLEDFTLDGVEIENRLRDCAIHVEDDGFETGLFFSRTAEG